MSQGLRILGIPGSLRRGSWNRAVLGAAAELAPPGVSVTAFDLGDIPPFNEDQESDPPAAVIALKREIRAADAVLFVTPEYNYSIPGVLKNAIDWASRPYGDSAWAGKPAAIMGASPGSLGTARAQYHLRQMMVWLDMYPLNKPEVMIGNVADKFGPDGRLTDRMTRQFMRQQLEALAAWTARLRTPEAGAPDPTLPPLRAAGH